MTGHIFIKHQEGELMYDRAHLHQTLRRGTYVGQGTSSSNTEKCNLCMTGHIFIKHQEGEIMYDRAHLHKTMIRELM